METHAFTNFYKWKNNICVYIESKKQHTQPDKPSGPPSQAHCQSFSGGSFTCPPLGLKVHNMRKQSAHPQVGKTLKLCKNNYFEGT